MDSEILQSLRLKGAIQAPPLKSYTHRAVVMGALANGTSRHKGAVVETYNDHRIVMALIIAALPLQEKTLIKNIECIKVLYPAFLEDLKKLGRQFQVIDS